MGSCLIVSGLRRFNAIALSTWRKDGDHARGENEAGVANLATLEVPTWLHNNNLSIAIGDNASVFSVKTFAVLRA